MLIPAQQQKMHRRENNVGHRLGCLHMALPLFQIVITADATDDLRVERRVRPLAFDPEQIPVIEAFAHCPSAAQKGGTPSPARASKKSETAAAALCVPPCAPLRQANPTFACSRFWAGS